MAGILYNSCNVIQTLGNYTSLDLSSSKPVKILHMYRVWFGISGSKSVFLNPIFYGNFVCLRSESVTNHPDGSLFVKPEKILITLSK